MHWAYCAEIEVRRAGYKWEEEPPRARLIDADEPDPEDKLTPGTRGAQSEPPFRYYNPFDKQPALFRIFADLDPGDGFERDIDQFCDDVLSFANRYGVPQQDPDEYPYASGEEIAGVATEMRLAVELWQAWKSGNRESIKSLLRLPPTPSPHSVSWKSGNRESIKSLCQQPGAFFRVIDRCTQPPLDGDGLGDEFGLALEMLKLLGNERDEFELAKRILTLLISWTAPL